MHVNRAASINNMSDKDFVEKSEMNLTEEACDDEIDKCPSPVPFSLKQHDKPLSLRRGVNLTCDVTVRDYCNWGPEMRNSPWDSFRFHEARYFGDSDCDEGMPDMDPPKKPQIIFNSEDEYDTDQSEDEYDTDQSPHTLLY